MPEDILAQLGSDPLESALPTKEGESKKPKAKKQKVQCQVPRGRACILSTYNNTTVMITDPAGGALVWSSAGRLGFKGAKRSTPYAAALIAKDVVNRAREAHGLGQVDVLVKGIGPGRESAIRSLVATGLDILSIKDVTPVPHGGCRPKGRRRV